MPKADEENNTEEDESGTDQHKRTPGSLWSPDIDPKIPKKFKLENVCQSIKGRMLNRKGDEVSVRDEETKLDDQQFKPINDCRKHGDAFESVIAAPESREVQLQKDEIVQTGAENNASEAPNKLRNPGHEQRNVGNIDNTSLSVEAEHDLEKLVEYYAVNATQQKLDNVGDVKTMMASSNMDVRVVVTNIVEEMEDQLVGSKAREEQQQDKLVPLSESNTRLEKSVPMEGGVNQEELQFIKELVAQLDREEKEERVNNPDWENRLINQLDKEDTVAQMDLEDSSHDILVSTSKSAFMSGSRKQATEKCTLCKERFTADIFRRHQMLPHDFECNVEGCDFVCAGTPTLSNHKREVHFIGCLQQDIQYRCEACEEVMAPGPQFAKHIDTAHCFACNYCDLRFVEEEKLRKHERNYHKGKEKRKSSD